MSDAAVQIRGACKHYGSGDDTNAVLDNLDMTVHRGSIYGLLGASGCGKTTLLSCIVGRRELNSGEIWVLGGKPGSPGSGVPGPRIGYMPQDIALVAEFSVKDAVFYFGRMYGMTETRLQERLDELAQLLDLPPSDRLIRNCSGGQQRRVSFAAALVHEPELLILDEPTVGLDPVLRESIWKYLVEVTVKHNIAVIITTHYIEETRHAHRIGLMRGGKLLAEESPDQLMRLFGSDSLEDVFLMLSVRQSRGESVPELQSEEYLALQRSRTEEYGSKLSVITTETSQIADSTLSLVVNKMSEKTLVYKSQSRFLCHSRLKALLGKNVIQLCRNPAAILFALIFPIIETLAFFGAVGGDPQNLRLAIVNLESNHENCMNYTSHFETAKYYPHNDTCELNLLSCRFLDHLEESTALKEYYDDLDSALIAVRRGFVEGAVYFGKNFTEATLARRNDGRKATDADVLASEIQIWLDMSDRPIGTVLQTNLYNTYFEFIKKILGDCQDLPKLGEIPVRYMEPVFGKKKEQYTVFMVPGVIVTLLFFLTTSVTSSIIITDRLEGVWDRSIVAGVSTAEIMVTHFITQFLMMLMQLTEILILSFWAFGVECKGDYITAIALTMLQGVAGICNGFLISVVCSTYSAANIASTGLFYLMILLCAIVWPLQGMPDALRWFSLCLPFTYPILSMRNILVKGWGILEPQVLNGFLISIGWIILYCVVSFVLIKRKS